MSTELVLNGGKEKKKSAESAESGPKDTGSWDFPRDLHC